MSNFRKTKKALMVNVMSMLLCVVMLIGATLAWFTASISSKDNKIQAGVLDVQLLKDGQDISNSSEKVFNYNLWEPGYSASANLSVKNNGTLALRYELAFKDITVKTGLENATGEFEKYKDHLAEATGDISEVLDVYVLDSNRAPTVDDVPVGTLKDFMGGKAIQTGNLLAGETSAAINIVVKMRQTAGNAYQNASADFDILLRATQHTHEKDGFGNNLYDENAFDEMISSIPVNPDGNTVLKTDDGNVIVTVPSESIEAGTNSLILTVIPRKTVGDDSITIVDGVTDFAAYDIKISTLKENNVAAVTVNMFVGKGRTINGGTPGVDVYKQDIKIENATYNSNSGFVTYTYVPTGSSTVPITIVFDDPEARIEDYYYYKLNQALKVGGNVTMLKDVDMSVSTDNDPTIQTSCNFNMDGHTLTIQGALSINSGASVSQISNVTISNGVIKSKGGSEDYADLPTIDAGVTNLTLNDVDISKTGTGVYIINMSAYASCFNGSRFVSTYGDSTLTINGGTLVGRVSVNGSVDWDKEDYPAYYVTANINNGTSMTLNSDTTGIFYQGNLSTLNINGGTFNCKYLNHIGNNGSGNLNFNILRGSFTVEKYIFYSPTSLDNGSTIKISGGTFNGSALSDYMSATFPSSNSNYIWSESNGIYTVTKQ